MSAPVLDRPDTGSALLDDFFGSGPTFDSSVVIHEPHERPRVVMIDGSLGYALTSDIVV